MIACKWSTEIKGSEHLGERGAAGEASRDPAESAAVLVACV